MDRSQTTARRGARGLPLALVVLALGLATLGGCQTAGGFGLFRNPPATLFHNATFYLSPDQPPVEAVVVRGKRIAMVGKERDLRRQLPRGYKSIDLGGGVAVPGLMDAHGHVAGYGASLESVSLRDAGSYAELIARVKAQAARQAPGTWITGRGWDQSLWEVSAFPHHAELSAAVPDHPVLLRRVDGHAALANELALERAGLNYEDSIPLIEGGRVETDERGIPTGMLIDTAIRLVGRHVPDPGPEDIRRQILRAQEALLAVGLVCVHDMGIDPETARIFEELDEAGELELRVIAYLWGNDGMDTKALQRYPREEDASAEEHLRIIGAKLMLDGALGSRGAALLEPYADAPHEHGLLRMDLEGYLARVRALTRAGLQPATHAIGDAANRMLLDAYAQMKQEDPFFPGLRPRIEHAQVVAPSDWGRFEELGVIASMQPTHATTDMRWAEARLGSERLEGAYAWRRLVGDPGHLAFGSDFPVESPDPLEGLYAARTRMDREGSPAGGWLPDQALTGTEALSAFTRGAAYAAHEEEQRGRLEVGYFADMSVLDTDPVRCEPEELLEARVLMTVIDGKIVHDNTAPDGANP